MGRKPDNQTFAADALDSAPERLTRYMPGPHNASELAAIDAALEGSQPAKYVTGTRLLVGTAAIAVAVTVPDFSLFAMGSPYARIEMGGSQVELPTTVWTPAARPTAPVYVTVMAAEEISPDALTFSSRPRIADFNRPVPLDFLETGSERFDLAFAGVELPSPVPTRLPANLPQAHSPRERPSVRRVADTTPAPFARLVEMPQIGTSRSLRPAPVPGLRAATASLAPEQSGNANLAAGNQSLEAAFAGAIDVSSAVRDAIPAAQRPVREPVARAVPIPAPDPALNAAAAAQAEMVPKTRLGARVNGVLTGSVEFRQLDGTIAIRLGSVVDMLRDRFSASEFEQLRSGRSANSYVTLGQLQAAGIPISYNPAYDEVEFGIDYQDAPQAGKVQVEQIGTPTAMGESVMIDQIPR